MKSILIISLLTALIISPVSAQDTPVFRAGAFAADVTPQQFPLNMPGGFSANKAEGANDPLHARALVLDDGETSLALVVVDVVRAHSWGVVTADVTAAADAHDYGEMIPGISFDEIIDQSGGGLFRYCAVPPGDGTMFELIDQELPMRGIYKGTRAGNQQNARAITCDNIR